LEKFEDWPLGIFLLAVALLLDIFVLLPQALRLLRQ